MTKENKEISDKILAEWDQAEAPIKLPSRFQIDNWVTVDFDGIKFTGEIRSVRFYPGKVKYDIEVCMSSMRTRIYNVDSVFVTELGKNV